MIEVKTIIRSGIWIAVFVSILLLLLTGISSVSILRPQQLEIPNGTYVKEGSRVFYRFLKDVKQENGIVVLGTSETGADMNGNNYWGLLDKDKDLPQRFYSFGGAGRNLYMYFPLILDNPKAFEGLELLIYVNPTYWRKGLNTFKDAYYNRYLGQELIAMTSEKAKNEKLFASFYMLNEVEELPFKLKLSRVVEDFKSFYSYDLQTFLNQNSSFKKEDLSEYYSSSSLDGLKSQIDSNYNASFEFVKKHAPFPEIDSVSTFQYDVLQAFIDLSKKYNIKCTYYLGPVNEVYCQKMNPQFLPKHQEVVVQLKKVFETNRVNYIDGTYQATLPGTFSDVQHISEYGAALTALDIKRHYEKAQ